MQQSYVATILTQIAGEINRPVSSVQPFISILEENWYDSKEALQDVSDAEFEKMKIPLKIVSLLKSKLSNIVQQSPPVAQMHQQQATQPQPQQQSHIQYQQTNQQSNAQHTSPPPTNQDPHSAKFSQLIGEINFSINDKNQLLKTLQTLEKINSNVVQNPLNTQFYQLKLASKILQANVMGFPLAWQYLQISGWQVEGENIVLSPSNLDFEILKSSLSPLALEVGKLVQQSQEQPKFNPYQAYFSATGDGQLTNSTLASKSGYDVYSFSDQLEQLKQKRMEVMSLPISNRDLKIYKGQAFQSASAIVEEYYNEADQIQPNSDPLLQDYLKKIAQSLEEQKFASKRKKEFQDLFNKPIFSETLIRIKMPDSIIFEAKFSPLETIHDYEIHYKPKNLENPALDFYLYMTPPIVKMTTKYNSTTLDDLECVPSGLFYLGFENPDDEKLLYHKLKPFTKQDK